MSRSVIFYEDNRGFSSVDTFIDQLDEKAKTSKSDLQLLKKVTYYIETLEQRGTRAGDPFTKFIDDGIWELRPGKYRIFFFIDENGDFVLLHQFLKKSKKTPSREIKKAKREREDWIKHSRERLSRKNQ